MPLSVGPRLCQFTLFKRNVYRNRVVLITGVNSTRPQPGRVYTHKSFYSPLRLPSVFISLKRIIKKKGIQ